MPVRNTACPYCGHEAMVNVPNRRTTIKKVTKHAKITLASHTKAACTNSRCDETFFAYYG